MAILKDETITTLYPIELCPLPAKPLVSILVSNYNYARYISETIESALNQTYSNIELIICDDGSTDDSVRIIEQYQQKDSRVQLIRKANWRAGLWIQCGVCREPGSADCPARFRRLFPGIQGGEDSG